MRRGNEANKNEERNTILRIDTALIEATTDRYRKREKQRVRNKRLIREGRLLAADSPERVEKFLARRGFGEDAVAALVRQPRSGSMAASRRELLALERVLGTSDLMGVAFLEGGLRVARSVGRVWIDVRAVAQKATEQAS